MNGCSLVTNTLLWWIACNNFTTVLLAMPRSKEFHGGRGSGEVIEKFEMETTSNSEPSCEELKAMWRFSKRQSRAAEVTNEIPTYRDPFSFNVWDAYLPQGRNTQQALRPVTRSKTRPVYGIMIHKPNSFRVHDVIERNRAFEGFNRYYPYDVPRRGKSAARLPPGAGISIPQSGSFQHLKELIRTERAKELQEQRLSEEIAARAANGHKMIPMRSYNRDRNRDRDRDRNRDFDENFGLTYVIDDEHEMNRDNKHHKVHYPGVLIFPNVYSRTTRGESDLFVDSEGEEEEPMDYYQDFNPHNIMYRRNFYMCVV